MRAVIYARCYDRPQDPCERLSIDHQISVCYDYVADHQWMLVGQYWDNDGQDDLALSRHAVTKLIEDAEDGAFDVIVATSLNQFSRDAVQVAVVCDCMQQWHVNIATLDAGMINLSAVSAAVLHNKAEARVPATPTTGTVPRDNSHVRRRQDDGADRARTEV